MGIIQFIKEVRKYGFRVASGNLLILFTKWYVKSDRIRLEWEEGDSAPDGIIKSKQTPKEELQ
jgi:hypothetical protein